MESVKNLSEAAALVGVSRPTLYRLLERPEYKPEMVAGHPTLTVSQIEQMKRERRKSRNGSSKKRR